MKVRKRETKSGPVYWIDFRFGGERVRRDLPRGLSKKEAEETAAILYSDLCKRARLGENAGPSQAEKYLTVKDLLEQDRERPTITERTRRAARESAKPLIDIMGENFRVVNLTQDKIADFIKKRKTTGCKGRTINFSLALLRGALNRAVESGKLFKVPCKVRLVPEQEKEIRFLTLSEIQKLVAQCRNLPIGRPKDPAKQKFKTDLRFFAVINTLAYSGLRPGEAFKLRWRDLQLDAEVLKVESEKTAGKGTRIDYIPVPSMVTEAVREYRDSLPSWKPDELIFGTTPDKRKPAMIIGKEYRQGHVCGCEVLEDHRLHQKLKAAAKRAGLVDWERVTPYSLRHSYASALVKGGSTIPEVARLMRHSPRMTLRYAHADQQGLRDALLVLKGTSATVIDAVPAQLGQQMGNEIENELREAL